MSFRIEEKLLINFTQIFEFRKWISEKGYKKLYPNRKIKSLYFENKENKMFLDSEEGITPRKKIRIRSYPEYKDKKYFFEKKISSPEGRFKEKKLLKDNETSFLAQHGIFDNNYRFCYPKLYVEYSREYYDADICRLTIDTNIIYSPYSKKSIFTSSDPYVAVEIKADIKSKVDQLINSFPFQRVRFSKYCRGFNFLFNE